MSFNDVGNSQPSESHIPISSILGIKEPVVFRPHRSTQKAHVILKRVRFSKEPTEEEEKDGIVYFSLFAQRRIDVKPGKEILLCIDSADGLYSDQAVLLSGIIDDDSKYPGTHDIFPDKDSSTLHSCPSKVPPAELTPLRTRKTWSRRFHECQHIPYRASPEPVYASMGVQAEPRMKSSSVQAQPSTLSQSTQARPTTKACSVQAQPSTSMGSVQAQPRSASCAVQAQPPYVSTSTQAQPSYLAHIVQAEPSYSTSMVQAQPSYSAHLVQAEPDHRASSVQTTPSLVSNSTQVYTPTISSKIIQAGPSTSSAVIQAQPSYQSGSAQTGTTTASQLVQVAPPTVSQITQVQAEDPQTYQSDSAQTELSTTSEVLQIEPSKASKVTQAQPPENSSVGVQLVPARSVFQGPSIPTHSEKITSTVSSESPPTTKPAIVIDIPETRDIQIEDQDERQDLSPMEESPPVSKPSSPQQQTVRLAEEVTTSREDGTSRKPQRKIPPLHNPFVSGGFVNLEQTTTQKDSRAFDSQTTNSALSAGVSSTVYNAMKGRTDPTATTSPEVPPDARNLVHISSGSYSNPLGIRAPAAFRGLSRSTSESSAPKKPLAIGPSWGKSPLGPSLSRSSSSSSLKTVLNSQQPPSQSISQTSFSMQTPLTTTSGSSVLPGNNQQSPFTGVPLASPSVTEQSVVGSLTENPGSSVSPGTQSHSPLNATPPAPPLSAPLPSLPSETQLPPPPPRSASPSKWKPLSLVDQARTSNSLDLASKLTEPSGPLSTTAASSAKPYASIESTPFNRTSEYPPLPSTSQANQTADVKGSRQVPVNATISPTSPSAPTPKVYPDPLPTTIVTGKRKRHDSIPETTIIPPPTAQSPSPTRQSFTSSPVNVRPSPSLPLLASIPLPVNHPLPPRPVTSAGSSANETQKSSWAASQSVTRRQSDHWEPSSSDARRGANTKAPPTAPRALRELSSLPPIPPPSSRVRGDHWEPSRADDHSLASSPVQRQRPMDGNGSVWPTRDARDPRANKDYSHGRQRTLSASQASPLSNGDKNREIPVDPVGKTSDPMADVMPSSPKESQRDQQNIDLPRRSSTTPGGRDITNGIVVVPSRDEPEPPSSEGCNSQRDVPAVLPQANGRDGINGLVPSRVAPLVGSVPNREIPSYKSEDVGSLPSSLQKGILSPSTEHVPDSIQEPSEISSVRPRHTTDTQSSEGDGDAIPGLTSAMDIDGPPRASSGTESPSAPLKPLPTQTELERTSAQASMSVHPSPSAPARPSEMDLDVISPAHTKKEKVGTDVAHEPPSDIVVPSKELGLNAGAPIPTEASPRSHSTEGEDDGPPAARPAPNVHERTEQSNAGQSSSMDIDRDRENYPTASDVRLKEHKRKLEIAEVQQEKEPAEPATKRRKSRDLTTPVPPQSHPPSYLLTPVSSPLVTSSSATQNLPDQPVPAVQTGAIESPAASSVPSYESVTARVASQSRPPSSNIATFTEHIDQPKLSEPPPSPSRPDPMHIPSQPPSSTNLAAAFPTQSHRAQPSHAELKSSMSAETSPRPAIPIDPTTTGPSLPQLPSNGSISVSHTQYPPAQPSKFEETKASASSARSSRPLTPAMSINSLINAQSPPPARPPHTPISKTVTPAVQSAPKKITPKIVTASTPSAAHGPSSSASTPTTASARPPLRPPKRERKTPTKWPTNNGLYATKLQPTISAGESQKVPVVIKSVAFSTDGSHLAVCCSDKSIRIWHNRTKLETARLTHNSDVVDAVWLDGSATILLLSADDGVVSKWTRGAQQKWKWDKLFDAGKETMPLGPDDVMCLAYDRDRVAVSMPTQGVKVFILQNGSWGLQRTILKRNITTIKFVDGGRALIGGTKEGVLWHVQIPQGTLRAFAFMQVPIQSLDVNPFGNQILVCLTTGSANLVSIATKDGKGSIEKTYSNPLVTALPRKSGFGAVFAASGQAVIFGSVEGCALVWDTKKSAVVYALEHDEGDEVKTVSVYHGIKSRGGNMVTGTRNGELVWWLQPVSSNQGEQPNKRAKLA